MRHLVGDRPPLFNDRQASGGCDIARGARRQVTDTAALMSIYPRRLHAAVRRLTVGHACTKVLNPPITKRFISNGILNFWPSGGFMAGSDITALLTLLR
jgi:hypothetical protein